MCIEGPPRSSKSDKQTALLERSAHGDSAAFRELHRQTAPWLLASVRRIQPDRAIAEDVVQEVFIKLWHSAGDFDPAKGLPSTWLGSVARNAARDSLRRQAARPRSSWRQWADDESDPMDQFVSHLPGTVDVVGGRLDARSLCQCLGRLPSAHRQSLTLAYFHDLPHAEVALHMRQPLGTVKSWLRRSLMSLRDCMQGSTQAVVPVKRTAPAGGFRHATREAPGLSFDAPGLDLQQAIICNLSKSSPAVTTQAQRDDR